MTEILWRAIVVTVATSVALWLLAAALTGFDIAGREHAPLAGFVVDLLNAVVWPVLATIVVPISVLSLGIGAIVLDALVVGLVLDDLPGVDLDGFWSAVAVVIGLAVINAVGSSVLALDDDVLSTAPPRRRPGALPRACRRQRPRASCSCRSTGWPRSC